MTKDFKLLSLEELKDLLVKSKNEKVKLKLKLASRDEKSTKEYNSHKTTIARILTEIRSRELTSQSN